MFTFANCLILAFLFVVASSKSTKIQHQNPPQFWHKLMKENGIWNNQIKQMADEMDESDPLIEKLSKEENYKKPTSPSPELDNFYELVKGQEQIAKLLQDLAKTFINTKSSLIENAQIEITTILGKTENAVNFFAEQNEIVYEKAKKIELPEVVKSMATIWSEMSRINNGENVKEIVQKIVNLRQLVKQNDKGKNRRRKRVVPIYPRNHSNNPTGVIIVCVLAFVCVMIICVLAWCKWRRS